MNESQLSVGHSYLFFAMKSEAGITLRRESEDHKQASDETCEQVSTQGKNDPVCL